MEKALIVIDMQEGFRYPASERIIPKIQKQIHSFDGKIIFAAFKDRKNSLISRMTDWKKFQQPNARRMMHEFHPANKFWHETYTVLTPEMIRYLKKNGIDTIFLCGIYTDICILKTAMDAVDLGMDVKVIKNACASLHGKKIHDSAIESLKHAIGKRNVIWGYSTFVP